MKVFVTGATGFIGSALIVELVAAGYEVLGLTRSEEGTKKLSLLGAQAQHGSLEDLASLQDGAGQADAVVHLAYSPDVSNFAENSRRESDVIEALASELAGSDRPLVITSVAAMGSPSPGQIATEDFFDPNTRNPRKTTEIAGAAALDRGVNVSVVRLSQIHSPVKLGFVSRLVQIARSKGNSAYVGEGQNKWAAAALTDTVRLYRLGLEKAERGARYNAVGEQGIPVRQIAEIIAQGLGVTVKSLKPEEAETHFGLFALFAGMDMEASSLLTQKRLGWQPIGPSLLQDLKISLE